MSKRAETLVPWKFFFSFLAALMRLEKGLLLFVRGDLAVFDEVLLVAVWIQAIRELGFLSLA